MSRASIMRWALVADASWLTMRRRAAPTTARRYGAVVCRLPRLARLLTGVEMDGRASFRDAIAVSLALPAAIYRLRLLMPRLGSGRLHAGGRSTFITLRRADRRVHGTPRFSHWRPAAAFLLRVTAPLAVGARATTVMAEPGAVDQATRWCSESSRSAGRQVVGNVSCGSPPFSCAYFSVLNSAPLWCDPNRPES
jgi:hypothetical protein